jgi:hypothetical protein
MLVIEYVLINVDSTSNKNRRVLFFFFPVVLVISLSLSYLGVSDNFHSIDNPIFLSSSLYIPTRKCVHPIVMHHVIKLEIYQ